MRSDTPPGVSRIRKDRGDLEWIESEVRKRASFRHIIFQKASAAISLNCGPGTFGLLYMDEDKQFGHLGDMLIDAYDRRDEEAEEYVEPGDAGPAAKSGDEARDAFLTVLQIFYDSIPAKSEEIGGFYQAGDWENFTIKVHALKSSARLVGATGLGEEAQQMENAGKSVDIDYIHAHYTGLMEDYLRYQEHLKATCGKEDEGGGEGALRPYEGML